MMTESNNVKPTGVPAPVAAINVAILLPTLYALIFVWHGLTRINVGAALIVGALAISSEVNVGRIAFRGGAIGFNWNEVSIVVGVFILDARSHLAAQLIAATAASLLRRYVVKNAAHSFWSSTLNVTLQVVRVLFVTTSLRIIAGAAAPSVRTAVALTLGFALGEIVIVTFLALALFQNRKALTPEFISSTAFTGFLSLLVATGTFCVIAIGTIQIGLVLVAGLLPLIVILSIPRVATVVEESNQLKRQSRFVRLVDTSDSSLESILYAFRTELNIKHIEFAGHFDGELIHHVVSTENSFTESVHGTPALWDEFSERPYEHVAIFKKAELPSFLSEHDNAMVVTVGSATTRSVWIAAGDLTASGGFTTSFGHTFTNMCWSTHRILDDRRRLADAHNRAERDPLTGIANREGFRAALDREVERAHTSAARPVTVIVFDVDLFKSINDSWGHHIGDMYLVHLAQELLAAAPPGAVVARLSGDEFAVALIDRSETDSQRDIQRLNLAISTPYELRSNGAVVIEATASAGYVTYPSERLPRLVRLVTADSEVASKLLRHADAAMHAAKRSPKTEPVEYNPKRDSVAEQNDKLAADVRNALASDQLRIYLQPIFLANTLPDGHERVIVSLEALARIEHPAGLIMPSDFVRVAEQTKQIHAVTERVLDLACAQLAKWKMYDITVAVNFSAANLMDASLIDKVSACLKRHAIEPNRLVCEVTETMTTDQSANIKMLHRIRDLGVRISLDDFGSGYSSLARLASFPVDEVKIDREFVVNAMRQVDPNDQKAVEELAIQRLILERVFNIARDMRLPHTIEGVETVEELNMVLSLGAHKLQGYYASKPLPVELADQLVRAHAKKRVMVDQTNSDATVAVGLRN